MALDDLSDDYVANLLKQDAKATAKRGASAFLPQRPTTGAPKPNTRFLRNIIRDTDSHNAALLAKETAESRARLSALRAGRREHSKSCEEGELSRPVKCRRVDESEDDEADRRRREKKSSKRAARDTLKDGSERSSRVTGSTDMGREERAGRSDRHHSHRRHRHRSTSEDRETRRDDGHRKHKRRRPSGRSPSSPSPDRDRHRRRHQSSHRRRDSSGPPPAHRQPDRAKTNTSTRSPAASPQPPSDSDPLEAIVGPLPPPSQALRNHVKFRGRGAFSTTTAIDAHFHATYDPSTDITPEVVDDDWEQALEAYRDRAKWKAQGAERLRAAGFTDEEVRNWEKGSKAERGEGDLRWGKRGEGREWDRGKIVVDGESGYGRLKGT